MSSADQSFGSSEPNQESDSVGSDLGSSEDQTEQTPVSEDEVPDPLTPPPAQSQPSQADPEESPSCEGDLPDPLIPPPSQFPQRDPVHHSDDIFSFPRASVSEPSGETLPNQNQQNSTQPKKRPFLLPTPSFPASRPSVWLDGFAPYHKNQDGTTFFGHPKPMKRRRRRPQASRRRKPGFTSSPSDIPEELLIDLN